MTRKRRTLLFKVLLLGIFLYVRVKRDVPFIEGGKWGVFHNYPPHDRALSVFSPDKINRVVEGYLPFAFLPVENGLFSLTMGKALYPHSKRSYGNRKVGVFFEK